MQQEEQQTHRDKTNLVSEQTNNMSILSIPNESWLDLNLLFTSGFNVDDCLFSTWKLSNHESGIQWLAAAQYAKDMND